MRLGHRIFRDQRLTTHCALVARAFGADKMIYTGERDSKMENSVKDVVKRWGGSFKVEHKKNWKRIIEKWKGNIIHLTMYGIDLNNCIEKIPKDNLLIIIGGEKVPSEIYQLSDFNISIKNQPHSEVAALALFLDKFKIKKKFENPKIKIIPQKKGKKLISK